MVRPGRIVFPVWALPPTRPSSNTPFLFCGGSVFGIPVSESLFCAGVLGRGTSPGGGASTRSYSYIFGGPIMRTWLARAAFEGCRGASGMVKKILGLAALVGLGAARAWAQPALGQPGGE